MSMRAGAPEDLVDPAAGRRTVAVLGEMAELGPDSAAYHQEIGKLVGDLGVVVLVAVGERGREYMEAAHGVAVAAAAADAKEASDVARGLVQPGDCVLVEGLTHLGRPRLGRRGAGPRVSRLGSPGVGTGAHRGRRRPRHLDPHSPEAHRLHAHARYGQHIREEGPQHHFVKAGTPTLGGPAILIALGVAFLSLSHYTTNCAARLLRDARLRRDSAFSTTPSS